MKREKSPFYSIVIPIHNEEDNLIPLFAKIVETMELREWDFEIVFVDDASTDGSFPLLEQIASLDSRVVVIQLRRNFGQSAALSAGFDSVRGDRTLPKSRHPLGGIFHEPHSAGGAKESSPGREPWDREGSAQQVPAEPALSPVPSEAEGLPKGAKEIISTRCPLVVSVAPSGARLFFLSLSQHLRAGLGSSAPLGGLAW